MSTDELALARESVAALLDRHPGGEAWAPLDDEGWLHLLPADATWESVDVVAGALDTIGARGHSVGYAPHIAAAATLAEAGVEHHTSPLAIATDLAAGVGPPRVRLWGDADATAAVADLGGDDLVELPASAWRRDAAVDELLDPVGVSWAELDLAAAQPLHAGPGSAPRHRARVAYVLAAEAAGAVRASALATVEYLKTRRAFGVSLSSFQALQHRAVDIYAASLLGDALVADATERLRDGADFAHASWAAKAYLGDVGTWAVENAIQLHGGIGFTWELGLHLGLRRTQRARLLGGAVDGTARQLLACRSSDRAALLETVTDWSSRGPIPDGGRS